MSLNIAAGRSSVIPLISEPVEPASGGCSACRAGQALPACQRKPVTGPFPPPRLRGDPLAAQTLLASLRSDLMLHAASLLPPHEWLATLSLDADEVTVQLTVPAHCGGVLLADAVFQCLRRSLPERDLYVLPAP